MQVKLEEDLLCSSGVIVGPWALRSLLTSAVSKEKDRKPGCGAALFWTRSARTEGLTDIFTAASSIDCVCCVDLGFKNQT